MPSRKILIIDDEVDLCLLLKDYFVRKDYEVHISHTLSEGRQMLTTLRPDIMFLDNNLPDATGWNTAPSIAESFPEMYIVLISAFHPSIPKLPAGTKFRIIEKPLSFSDLDKQFTNSELMNIA